jgi:hypothetical protein
LRSAYVYNLSNLEPRFFPHPDAHAEFESIVQAFTRYGEMAEGEGSVRTTTFTMSDADAQNLAERILALADRYLA